VFGQATAQSCCQNLCSCKVNEKIKLLEIKGDVPHCPQLATPPAGPYGNHLHLSPDRQPRQHLITQFFTSWILFLMPNQQYQSTEGKTNTSYLVVLLILSSTFLETELSGIIGAGFYLVPFLSLKQQCQCTRIRLVVNDSRQ